MGFKKSHLKLNIVAWMKGSRQTELK